MPLHHTTPRKLHEIYSTLNFVKTSAKNEYVGIFESLGDGSITIAVTVVVIIVISLIFALARTNLFAAKVAAEAQREREEADEAREMAEAKVLELRETNLKIRKELKLSGLNEDQVQIVKNKSSRIRELVPSVYKLEWATLLFEARLGSGSFGDCYRGTRAGRPVAIKKMRAGGFFPFFCHRTRDRRIDYFSFYFIATVRLTISLLSLPLSLCAHALQAWSTKPDSRPSPRRSSRFRRSTTST